MRYTTAKPMFLKPHSVVYHRVDRTFYEVDLWEPGDERGFFTGLLIEATGEIAPFAVGLYHRDVELIAPTHPVYIKWAARRLADRLEGLDRT